MFTWWYVAQAGSTAQDTTASVTAPLLQYGAVGILAAIALYAVVKLFGRQVAAHEKDIARADRLEAELREQNKMIQEKLVVQLTLATEAIAKLLGEQQKTRSR